MQPCPGTFVGVAPISVFVPVFIERQSWRRYSRSFRTDLLLSPGEPFRSGKSCGFLPWERFPLGEKILASLLASDATKRRKNLGEAVSRDTVIVLPIRDLKRKQIVMWIARDEAEPATFRGQRSPTKKS